MKLTATVIRCWAARIMASVATRTNRTNRIDTVAALRAELSEMRAVLSEVKAELAEEAEIQRHNAAYQQSSPIEQLLPELFEPTDDRTRPNLWQVQAVQKVMAGQLRTADIPSLRQLASAMKALRWPQGAANGTRGYYLKRRE